MGLFDFFKKKKAEEQAAAPETAAAEREELNVGLEKTKQGLFGKLARVVAGRSKVDDDMLDELEEILITSRPYASSLHPSRTERYPQQAESHHNLRRSNRLRRTTYRTGQRTA